MERETAENLVDFVFDFIAGVLELLAIAWAAMLLLGNAHAFVPAIPALGYGETFSVLMLPFVIYSLTVGILKGMKESRSS